MAYEYDAQELSNQMDLEEAVETMTDFSLLALRVLASQLVGDKLPLDITSTLNHVEADRLSEYVFEWAVGL